MGNRNLKELYLSTRLVHAGKKKIRDVHPHVTPIYQTVNFEYEDFDQGVRVGAGAEPGYYYTRYSNPTIDAFNETVALIEGGEEAFSFASGMAAITAAFLAFVRPGDHVVAGSVLYGGTIHFLTEDLSRRGVQTTFVDIQDMDAVERAMQKNTRILYAEPIMNPIVDLSDLCALSKIAKKRRVKFLVDNTFSPPYLQQPLAKGADLVIHSTTKFLSGHGDTLGGVVTGPSSMMEPIRQIGRMYGGVMSPFNAWLTLRGMRTLDVRLERSCRNAMAVAEFLSGRPEVLKVFYPGLKTHKQHALAKEQFGGYGAVVSFEVRGGLDAVRKVCNAFRVITYTVSLGETDTVASHPATSSHRHTDLSFREKYGISDGLIRLSVGIEDERDLIADLEQALKTKPAKEKG